MGNQLYLLPEYFSVLQNAAVSITSQGSRLHGVDLPELEEGGHIQMRDVSLLMLHRNKRSKLLVNVSRYGDMVLRDCSPTATHLLGLAHDLALFEHEEFRFLIDSKSDLVILCQKKGIAVVFNLKKQRLGFWYNALHKEVDPLKIVSFDQLVPFLQ